MSRFRLKADRYGHHDLWIDGERRRDAVVTSVVAETGEQPEVMVTFVADEVEIDGDGILVDPEDTDVDDEYLLDDEELEEDPDGVAEEEVVGVSPEGREEEAVQG